MAPITLPLGVVDFVPTMSLYDFLNHNSLEKLPSSYVPMLTLLYELLDAISSSYSGVVLPIPTFPEVLYTFPLLSVHEEPPETGCQVPTPLESAVSTYPAVADVPN